MIERIVGMMEERLTVTFQSDGYYKISEHKGKKIEALCLDSLKSEGPSPEKVGSKLAPLKQPLPIKREVRDYFCPPLSA